jgi:SAM-dependent methyltransferase
MSAVHDVAQRGFGEGTNDLVCDTLYILALAWLLPLVAKQQYDRVRPTYPPSALSHIHSSLAPGRSGGLNIIEPGSGTGIFTRLLISPPASGTHTFGSEDYPSWDITKLYSVEPSGGMRTQWEKGLRKLPAETYEGKEIRTVEGGFDDFSHAGIGEGEADLIVVAQAYHWCPDHEKAFVRPSPADTSSSHHDTSVTGRADRKREFGKYLKPNGILVFIWNLESRQHPFSNSILSVLPDYDQGTPQYYRMWWRKCFETDAFKELFGEEGKSEKTFAWSTPITDETVCHAFYLALAREAEGKIY